MRDYFDISPEVSPHTAVFPGDTPYARTVLLDFSQGGNLLLSKMETTVHIGAHADAPSHYNPAGQDIAARDLRPYCGPCQVLHVQLPRGRRILPQDLGGRAVQAPRVLFRTDSFPDPERWNSDFNALSPELVDALAGQGVMLVGIDTPSVDLCDDKVLLSHQAIFRHDMANLEGLVLGAVPEGIYQLTALPLRLRGADASPVRAVLWMM